MKNDVLKTENGSDTVTISRAEYERLMGLEQKLNWLMEQVSLARKKQYGPSSEKTQEGEYEQLSLLFNEAEVFAPKAEETTVAEHKRTKRSCKLDEALPENVPIETVEHGIDESERACPECGAVMERIGKEVRRTLVIVPAQVKIREDVYYSYACPKCRGEGTETPILKTPKLPAVIPGSHASVEAIAHIMTQKFVMASPLYRQEQEWKRAGVQLSRQTMSNWVLTAERDWLVPVYNELHRKLLAHDVLHADETTLQVLKEPGKSAQSKSCMWLYRTGIYAKHQIVLYEYKPNRKAENVEKFLEGFKG